MPNKLLKSFKKYQKKYKKLLTKYIINKIFCDKKSQNCLVVDQTPLEKSRIRETKHLSTDADSSSNAIGGWTKNTPKPDFFWKKEKILQNAKTQKRLEICQN